MTSGKTTLETLIDTTYDSVTGYRKAAELAKSPQLQQVLMSQADKRQQTLDVMNQELVRLGGELVTKGTAAGGLHRLWLNLTAMFENGDEAAVERVDEGEEYLAGKFDAALETDSLDPQTRAVIERGRAEVREGERLADQLERQYDN
ncbi:PA2169 family four-helix-bundle protein [Altererythrobacter sp. KTW20L]|uniref:ferritin-like domain-containing protein n=1 Tax=Altererythrobacter sp. KTW20L TaxID=2942210 RepID=UPI0020BD85BF|nr:PA2169 family four-helix-bundle protein [Altererythrobacter sp. KTW20L]MCL6249785.1 PA2169 family four-helix-bundle protein [Altererythrobacter sp. KTW20L]